MFQDPNHINRPLEALKAALEQKRFLFMKAFIEFGPDALRSRFPHIGDWKGTYDLLIREGVLRQCVLRYLSFFVDLMISKGPMAVRRVFQIEAPMYNQAFEEILDLVGISHGALYAYVEAHREEFAKRVMRGDVASLRAELGLSRRRYDHVWGEILDLLVNAVCDRSTEERTYDEGLRAFNTLMNGLREHRSLRSYGKMWEFARKA